MKESPIIFNTEMVQAILNGKKTQTRRILKPQPSNGMDLVDVYFNGLDAIGHFYDDWIAGIEPDNLDNCNQHIKFPFGAIGQLLYVRETFAPALGEFAYKADYSNNVLNEKRNKGLWKPSIHMPKSAARIWLKITDIRVERLQDISEEDAIKEGIKPDGTRFECPVCPRHFHNGNDLICEDGFFVKARRAFQSLWEHINGRVSWKANPWVWVITFERIEK